MCIKIVSIDLFVCFIEFIEWCWFIKLHGFQGHNSTVLTHTILILRDTTVRTLVPLPTVGRLLSLLQPQNSHVYTTEFLATSIRYSLGKLVAHSRCSIILKIKILQVKWAFGNNVVTIYRWGDWDLAEKSSWRSSQCSCAWAHVCTSLHACFGLTMLCFPWKIQPTLLMLTDSSQPQRPAACRGPRGFQCTWSWVSVWEQRHLVTAGPLSIFVFPKQLQRC